MAAQELFTTPLFNDANLLHYYRLEDTSDSKGSITLTNNNTVAFNTAKFNNGADGGSTNTNKSLSAVSNMGISGGASSFNFWVQLDTEITSGTWALFNQSDTTSKISFYIQYQYNAGSQQLAFNRDYNAGTRSVLAAGALGTSVFHMVTSTYDGTTLIGYVDGVSKGSITATDTGSGAFTTPPFTILAGGNGNTGAIIQWASAIIDDFSIFSRALTATEVSELYNGFTIAGYPFIGQQPQQIPDVSRIQYMYPSLSWDNVSPSQISISAPFVSFNI